MSGDRAGGNLRADRIVSRRGVSSTSAIRRRLFQRHLLLYLIASAGVVALDTAIVEPRGLQWAWWVVVPWTLVFAIHLLGLRARGFSFGELFMPPRRPQLGEDYPVPLDYEIVRARQLRDGIQFSANALTAKQAQNAREALSAADQLVGALERLVESTGDGGARDRQRAQQLVPEASTALESLQKLHEGLLAVELLEEPVEELPIPEVRERAEALARLSG